MSAVGSLGQADNDEGVSQYKQGHMDVATDRFQKAIKSDPKSAEAQYNLGLSFDKMGKHDEASAAFKQAVALAPANPAIKDSPTLKKHLGA
jgi:Flp pilus assembly protein TadD